MILLVGYPIVEDICGFYYIVTLIIRPFLGRFAELR